MPGTGAAPNRLPDERKAEVLRLMQSRDFDFNLTHALEKLKAELASPLATIRADGGATRRAWLSGPNDDGPRLAGRQHTLAIHPIHQGLRRAGHLRGIPAYSPQPKGRIERAWHTFQDRIVPELRLRKIRRLPSLQEQFLPGYWRRQNVVKA
jgi:hypothetical protein